MPDGVMICGIVTDVKVIDDEFTQNGYIYSGLFRTSFKDILLFKKVSVLDRLTNHEVIVVASVDEVIRTFYHELWHAICSAGSYEKSENSIVNTENNCELFANIAMVRNEDNALMEIFNEFKPIVTEISERDYRKLEYVVKNTKFEFDDFADFCCGLKVELGNSPVESLDDEPIEKEYCDSYYKMMSMRLDEIMNKDDEKSDRERIEMEVIAESLEKYEDSL